MSLVVRGEPWESDCRPGNHEAALLSLHLQFSPSVPCLGIRGQRETCDEAGVVLVLGWWGGWRAGVALGGDPLGRVMDCAWREGRQVRTPEGLGLGRLGGHWVLC